MNNVLVYMDAACWGTCAPLYLTSAAVSCESASVATTAEVQKQVKYAYLDSI